jgi:hypothetical protein
VGSGFGRQLRFCSVFIKASHCEPTIAWHALSVIHRDQAIGGARIPDHEHAHV